MFDTRSRSRRLAATALLSVLSAGPTALAAQPSADMKGMGGGDSSPADAAMMAGMNRMQQAMKAAPMTGNPDHDFVAMMIPHHQGAVSMAQVELQYGKDPSLRKLARNIIAAQDKEIAQMRAWLAAHPGQGGTN